MGLPGHLKVCTTSVRVLRQRLPEPQHIAFAIAHCGAGFLREALFLAYHTENIWVDTSGTNNWREYTPGAPSLEDVFRDLLRTYGPRRIMFGTDSTLPGEYREAILAEQRGLFERLGAVEEDWDAIFGGNARRLFGLPAPRGTSRPGK